MLAYNWRSLAFLFLVSALPASMPTALAQHRQFYQSDVWNVRETYATGLRACVVTAAYSDGTSFSLKLTTGAAWPVALQRPSGYQRGQRRVLTLFVDRDLMHEVMAVVDDEGIIRLDLPATEKTLNELSEGKLLEVRSSIGTGRFNLDGASKAIAAGRRCMLESAPHIASTGGPAVAGYVNRSNADSDQRARMDIQEALIWVGLYDGMIDGDIGPRTVSGMQAFMKAIGSDPGRTPSAAELGRLLRMAESEKSKAGFRIIRDERALVAIGIPTRYAPNASARPRGTVYLSADGSLKIDTLHFKPGERTLQDLFEQISKRGPITTIDYAKPPRDGEFVVTGRDTEKHYYFKAVTASDGVFAFSIAHSYSNKDEMSRVAVAMANFFSPLSLLDRKPDKDQPSVTPETGVSNSNPSEKESRGGSGTGFIVSSSSHILTNAHVVENCLKIEVNRAGEASVLARLVAADKLNDLALLKVNMSAVPLPRFRTAPRIGEAVNVFGFPLAGILATSGNFTAGNVTATSGLLDDTRMLQISAPLQSGNSGGPLLDQSGYVIGIIVSKLNVMKMFKHTGDLAQNVNFAIKSSAALSFLETNNVVAQMASEPSPKSSADVADMAKTFTVYIQCH